MLVIVTGPRLRRARVVGAAIVPFDLNLLILLFGGFRPRDGLLRAASKGKKAGHKCDQEGARERRRTETTHRSVERYFLESVNCYLTYVP